MPTLTDFLQQPFNGPLFPNVGTWVQLTNNYTTHTYVSNTASVALGAFTVPNVPAGSYTLSTGPTNTGPWTVVDANYIVGDVPLTFNVRDYGAKGDNSTDDSSALQAAINDAQATAGGKAVVIWPPGIYLFGTTLTVTTPGMTWQGSAGRGTGSIMACQLNYNGTGARAIDARNTVGFQMRDLVVFPTNSSFTGVAVDLSGASGSNSEIRDVTIQFPSSFGAGSTGVSWDSGQTHRMVRVGISRGAVQLQLGNAASCNHCQIDGCRFDVRSTLTTPIQGKVNGLAMNGTLVELNTTASVGGTLINLQGTSAGVVVNQLNVLDPGASSTYSAVGFTGSGFKMSGSVIGGINTTVGVSIGNGSTGIDIDASNDFVGGTTAVAFGTSVTGVQIGPFANTATNQVTGTPTGGIGLTPTGSTIYSATGAPSNSFGANGDFYFRQDTPGTANQRLYVKSAGSWTGIL